MKKLLLGATGVLAVGAAVAAASIEFGVPDFSADTPHSPIVHHLIAWAREQSIARRAFDIVPPTNLSDPARIRRGAGNYDAMCVECHLAPGVQDSEIRKGLYPTPPNLTTSAEKNQTGATDARRFWTIKHGIKGSGMPAWSKGGMEDEAIWDLTAFLKAMPSLSPEQYHREVELSEGHTHQGMDGHGAEAETEHEHHHDHDAPPHPHEHGAHHHSANE